MVNYQKTQEAYFKAGVPYVKGSDHQEQEDWRAQVADEKGNYRQLPDDKETEYPSTEVVLIARKLNLEDGKEYISTYEVVTGIDAYLNKKQMTRDYPQEYTVPVYETKRRVDPNNSSNIQVYKEKVTDKIVYTEPFSKEAAKKYFDKSNKRTVELIVKEIGRGRTPVTVRSFDDFCNKSFEELIDPADYERRQRLTKEQKKLEEEDRKKAEEEHRQAEEQAKGVNVVRTTIVGPSESYRTDTVETIDDEEAKKIEEYNKTKAQVEEAEREQEIKKSNVDAKKEGKKKEEIDHEKITYKSDEDVDEKEFSKTFKRKA